MGALTRVKYLRLATVLPLVAPFPLGALLVGCGFAGFPLPDWFGDAVVDSAMGVFLFAPVYVVIVGGILWLLRKRTWRAHALGGAIAPLLMALGVGVVTSVEGTSGTLWSALQLWGPFCLKVGYGYVALTLIGMLVLEREGVIREELL